MLVADKAHCRKSLEGFEVSQKIIDPHSLLDLYRSDVGRSRAEKSLFDKRLTEESDRQAREDRATFDRPAVPDAQIVVDITNGQAGVAVRGARRVCPLPGGYGGPGCELAMIDGDKLIVIQPDKPCLLIDPETGTTRRL